MLSRFAIAILATAFVISPVKAQPRGAAAGTRGIGRASFPGRGVGGSTRFHQGHRSVALPWYPYFDSDYGYDSEQAYPPPGVAGPTTSGPAPAASAPPIEPLLIEWRVDHFERMTLSEKTSTEEQGGPDYSEKSTPRSSVPGRKDALQPSPRELPPTVLVFRDGRKEEVSSYTIMSGTIYSKADYWSSGSWTKKIQIADLDVPATLKLNQEHGLKFELPAGPNEVFVSP
jgi:hypothetical protein